MVVLVQRLVIHVSLFKTRIAQIPMRPPRLLGCLLSLLPKLFSRRKQYCEFSKDTNESTFSYGARIGVEIGMNSIPAGADLLQNQRKGWEVVKCAMHRASTSSGLGPDMGLRK